MVLGSNTINFLNYIYHFIIGRMLGPAGYGELVSLISIIGIFGTIPASLGLVIIKYVSAARTKEEIDNLVGWIKEKTFQISVLIFLCILFLSPAVTSFLHITRLDYLILIAISYLFSLSSGFNRSILQGLLKFKEMVFSVLVESSFKLILSIVLVYLGFFVGGAIFAATIACVLGWFLTGIYLKKYHKKNITQPENIKALISFIFPALIQTVSVTLLYSSDVVLVKHFFSSHDAGIYGSLSNLGKVIFFGASPISAVMFPLVSKRYSSGDTYSRIFSYSLILTLLFSVVITLLYWVLPEVAINSLYGFAYLEAKGLLVWFGVFMSLFTLSSLVINLCLSLGKVKVIILPLIAAAAQILGIWLFHNNLFTVILVSIIITTLLLLSLLIYSVYIGVLFNSPKLTRWR